MKFLLFTFCLEQPRPHAMQCKEDIVRFIIRLNPTTTRDSWDAAFQAVRDGVSVNTQTKVGATLLHMACCWGLASVIKTLLYDLGADPSIEDCDNWRPMHYAACHGRLTVCKMLPKADLAARASSRYKRRTPLEIALNHVANPLRPGDLVHWMVDQPECPLDGFYLSPRLSPLPLTTLPYIAAAAAGRRRWSALRAAFVGAVGVCGP
jgi:hypothetical protein